MSNRSVVLKTEEWTPSQITTKGPRLNDRGGKQIPVISTETNRALQLSTPMMTQWGIGDFVDKETGESDGKYSMSLNFPNPEYSSAATDDLLAKFKAFEEQILNDAVANSEVWWGEKMSREVVKHTFFPFLKYPKNKDTKKTDYTKPPSIRVKVPYYNGKWDVELYDTASRKIFPDESKPELTPIDFVPKSSRVACVIKCTGIWIGGKGWGLTWKLVQAVAQKPRASLTGQCFLKLKTADKEKLKQSSPQITASSVEEDDEEDIVQPALTGAAAVSSTIVDDSDDEELIVPKVEPISAASSAASTIQTKKKIIKKKAVAQEEA
jgi:hypothetical protein